MDRTPGTTPGLFARLERRLKPLFGGAQVTAIDAPPTPLKPTREWACDTCGQPLRAHVFDDSMRGRMYCPEVRPAPDRTRAVTGGPEESPLHR